MIAAHRHIPATPDDLTGWQGPVVVRERDAYFPGVIVSATASGTSAHVYRHGRKEGPPVQSYSVEHNVFMRTDIDAVRDHMIRRYALPDWHRDTPGGLSAEVSAGLVLGSVLRVRAGMRYVLGMYKRVLSRQQPGDFEMYQMRNALPFAALPELPVSECMVWHGGDGRRKQIDELLAQGGAFLSDDGLLLPPIEVGGEPVLWSTR